MKYTEWELLNEAVGGSLTLGLGKPQTVGGPMGSRFSEAPMDLTDDDDDDDEDEDEEVEDDDDDGDEDDPKGILPGDNIDGPEKGFPPDDSEEQDGLPTPDEELTAGDDEEAMVSPEEMDLAGLGDDEEPGLDDLGDGEGAEMPGEDELGPELTSLGDEDLAALGDDGLGGEELGDEMGDELGGEMGDELGDEMGGLEGEMGDEMGPEEPCPSCNPDGEMEEGDPDCEECGGEGFLPPEGGEEMIDAELEGDPMMGDEMGAEAEGPAGEMMDLMSRMSAYCAKYMPAMMKAQMSAQMAPQMRSHSRKYLPKIAPDNSQAAKGGHQPTSGEVRRPNHPIKVKARSFMTKDAKCCKEGSDFLNSLANAAKGEIHQKFSATGLKKEDALLPPAEAQQDNEPQAGDVGFAPQGRVGSIGGGYTMDDFQDLPTLGESRKYNTWEGYKKKVDEGFYGKHREIGQAPSRPGGMTRPGQSGRSSSGNTMQSRPETPRNRDGSRFNRYGKRQKKYLPKDDAPRYLSQRDAKREMEARRQGVKGPQYDRNVSHPDFRRQDPTVRGCRKK
jgi:hypothetical protein